MGDCGRGKSVILNGVLPVLFRMKNRVLQPVTRRIWAGRFPISKRFAATGRGFTLIGCCIHRSRLSMSWVSSRCSMIMANDMRVSIWCLMRPSAIIVRSLSLRTSVKNRFTTAMASARWIAWRICVEVSISAARACVNDQYVMNEIPIQIVSLCYNYAQSRFQTIIPPSTDTPLGYELIAEQMTGAMPRFFCNVCTASMCADERADAILRQVLFAWSCNCSSN